MITVRAGKAAIGFCLLLLASGCSREQQDWRSAEAADTIEAYGQFIQRHPESELATQARTRVAQLGEERDWQHAGSADTVEAYREFIAQHSNGKWTQEARIRIENFALTEQKGTDAANKGSPFAATGPGGAASRGGGAGGPAVGAASRGGGAGAPAVGAAGRGGGAGAPAVGAAGLGGGAVADSQRSAGLAAPGESAVPVAQGRRVALSGGGSAAGTGDSAAAGGSASGGGSGSAGASQSGTGTGGFGVQLGAFTSEASANNEWRSLTGRFASELQGLHQHVVTADTASGRVYRLQATVGDESRARALCDSLRKRGQACVAVLPQ